MKGWRTGAFFALLVVLAGLAEALEPIRDSIPEGTWRWALLVSALAGLFLRTVTTGPPAWRSDRKETP